jgi:hypothetical protein
MGVVDRLDFREFSIHHSENIDRVYKLIGNTLLLSRVSCICRTGPLFSSIDAGYPVTRPMRENNKVEI